MIAVLLFAAVSLQPPTLPRFIDRVVEHNADGDVIVRTSDQSDFSGGTVRVDQRLRRLPGNQFLIDFADQTAATKVYHQALCMNSGMQPASGRGTLSGEDTISAWSCVSRSAAPGTSTDYSSTQPPSGSAAAEQQFAAMGSLKVKSSVAGALSYSVSVNNRRCYFQGIDRHSSPFELSAQQWVTCAGVGPGSLNTEMRACVPRACGGSQGSYRIR